MPEAIFAEPEVLGRVDPVAIGGFTGTASTPGDDHLRPAREYWEMVEWEWADPTDLEQPSGFSIELGSQEHVNWGWISSKPENGVAISALLLSLDYEKTTLAIDINGWLGTLSDWLQAYTLQVVAPHTAPAELISRSIRAWSVADGSPTQISYLPRRENVDIPPWVLVTPPIWKASLRRATDGDELPLHWQLLGDGLIALHAGHARRAVVEACTALEVTVREAVFRRVSLCGDAAIVDVIVKQRNTLQPLLNMAKDLGIHLSASLTRSLVELRNNVVHKGAAPSHEEALVIWNSAYGLLQEHNPLPSP